MFSNSPLSLSHDIFISQKNDKYLFLNPNLPDWLVVNENAAYILSQCDGKNSVYDIAKKINRLGRNDITSEVENLIKKALSNSIITLAHDNTPCTEELYTPNNEQIKSNHKLRIVHLKLTNECNLRCKYCYANSGVKSEILSFNKLVQLAEEVSSLSPSVEYVLSGGEPLLHPDCLNFTEKIKSNGNQAHLLSNGILINRNNAERISQLCDLVKISLDGASEQTHSLTRGKNNYNKVIDAIDLLLGLNVNLLVAMTVTRKNLHEIPILVNRYGSNLTFQPFFHAGRGRNHENLALSGKEYYDSLSSIPGVNPMGAINKVLSRAKKRGIFKCAIGDSEVSVSESGDVFPCQMLDDPLFKAGNIYKSSFHDIYYNSKELINIRKLTVNNIQGCESCPVRLICGGACRARTFHEQGQIDISGSFCEYERLAFINGIFDSTTIDSD